MKLEYDIPEEVTEKQFRAVMANCGGLLCGKQENGKFLIKLWLTKYRSYVLNIIDKNK